MYAVFEQHSHCPKRRVMADLVFPSLEAGVAHFNARGGYAEIDPDHDAADVFAKGGMVLSIEPLKD